MSIKVIYNNELISLLSSIFYESPFEKDEFLPIIRETKSIPNVISFLKPKNNAKMNIDNEISLMFFLKNLFSENNNLIPLFINQCKKNKETFIESLINFYLNEEIEGQSLQMIEDLINTIIYHISISKNNIEYIYQQLTTYFNIKQDEVNADTPILTEQLLLRYLKLLNFFYTDIKNENLSNDKNVKDMKDKIIRNYLYFNGLNSGMTLILNKSSNNINIDFPSLNEGLSLIFHINLDNELLDNYFKAILSPENKNIFLIKISIGSHLISVVLKNTEYISIIIDNVESEPINITGVFNYNFWNSIMLLIDSKNTKKKGSIKIAINDDIFTSSLSLPKLGNNEKIDNIILFENLIGKVTSIMLFSFVIETKLSNFFSSTLYGGFYKNTLLFKFLHSIDKDYCKNIKNFKEYEKYKGEKSMTKIFNISIGLSDINKNKIISILCPFMYNQNENKIDDAFGIFIGKFLSGSDGVNFNYKNVKNIKKLGGIYNLLPIAELMLSSMKENSDYFVDENILTEATLLQYLKIIKHILNHHKESIIEINKNKFFSCLGLFLEKFSSNIFTEQILNILLEICGETFRYKENYNPKINNESDLYKYKFINIIIFNRKIISKFSHENQLKIWEGIYDFLKKDTSQVKDALDIPKIIILLRFYDTNRYEKYCCKKHASLFGCVDDNEIMKPEINSRIGKLFEIIQLYIDKVEPEKEQFNLYKILSLDLSPCLIQKVIQIYILHFINDKISDKIKEKTLINLLTNNYFEITEYSLSVSLLDVRSEIIKLLHIIFLKYKEKIFEYIKKCSLNQNQIFSYISKNILPTDEKINQISEIKNEENIIKESDNNGEIQIQTLFFKDNLLGKYKNQNLLPYYFNQKLYEDDINILWGLLNSWMLENSTVVVSNPPATPQVSSGNILSKTLNALKKEKLNQENKIKKEEVQNNLIINPFILSFSVDFVSNVKPTFIDSFLTCISFSLKKTQNKDVIFKDKKFFHWLIATIFFFHNRENENKIEEKDLIPSIQNNSIELLCQIFKIKTSLKDIENKMYYLMEYSFFLKKNFITDNGNLTEIIRITRLIFEKLLTTSDMYLNIKVLFAFEFIFFYKNSKEILSNFIFEERTSSLLDPETLKKTIKKLKIEEIDIRNSSRRSIDIDESQYFTERKTVGNETPNPEAGETMLTNINIDLIPDYYYKGCFFNQLNQSNEENIQNKRTLKNIWSDYELFSSIINYYRNNVWGPETLFKSVKMEYKPEINILESCKTLLNNYGDTKEYRNILFKKIKKLVIMDDDYQNPINKINLLYLNIILLCFSMDIGSVLSEKEEITQQIIEFIIFCILASININQIEETYNYIQKKIYDTLSFGLLFLKDKDEARYRELMFYLIEPFFDGLSEKSNIKKIFGTKKSLFKNSAIYRVFIKSDGDNYDGRATRMEDSHSKKGSSSSLPKKRLSNTHKKTFTNKQKKNKATLFIRPHSSQVIKHIFDRVLYFFKEKKHFFNKENSLILFYFKEEKNSIEKDNNSNKEMNDNNVIEQEKKRINIFMKKLIPSVFSEVKKGSISSYLEEKKRRNQYKKIKKKLFSWNGFWTDKYLFLSHSEYLKFRIKNHFCRDMSKVLLSPILDLNYYLPIFSKFKISNLFNKGNKKYKISMDVEDILNIDNKIESNKAPNIQNYIKNNSNNFNYLVSLYKYQYNNIWEIYSRNFIEEKNNDLNNNNLNAKEVFELLFQNKLNLINEENVLYENIYTCCIVKPTHHIKGYITTESSCIKFTYCPDNESKELLEKDPSYDKDMGACFGSTFKKYYKDKDKIFFEIKYKSIEYMFKRNYFYQETGLEIFTYAKKSYFLNFKSNQELEKFINDIIFHEQFRIIKCHGFKGKKYIGYCKLFNTKNKKESYDITNKLEEWYNNNISTFEYIMWLNIFSGRSFNDLTQYPVFPWIITNYENEEIDQDNDIRNMSLPVGMFDFNEKAEMRKETFKEFYETLKNELKESKPDFDYEEFLEKEDVYLEHYNQKKLKNNENVGESISEKIEINQLPYFYGSHYSNPTYVSHYLTRIFPHASISIEIHGDKFDDPNRMFFSMKRTFETASTLKDDIRELIPEFFVLPEMFLNLNNFNLSQDKLDSEGKKIIINNVELPPWSNNKNINFLIEMRKNLEKINLKINKWIDLIFGYLQRGQKAEENNNIFMPNTYEDMVKIENIKEDDEKNALMRLVEVGVTPIQLLTNESKERGDIKQILSKPPYCYSKGPFLWESTDLKSFNITMYKYQKLIQKLGIDYKKNDSLIYPRIIKMKALNKNELKILTNCNYWFNLKFIRNENKYLIEESSLSELFNISSKYGSSYLISNIKIPVIIFGNNKFIIKGGFWDGRIEINVINPDSKEEKDNINFSIHVEEGPVILIEISKDENLLLCGTMYGYIVAYEIEYINNNTNIQLNLIKKIFDHDTSINSICINDNLNMFATSSNNEYVHLYLLPSFEIFRVIKIDENDLEKNNKEELIIPNNVFLSNCPLPCICIYINSRRIFKSYTINGQFIGINKENNNSNEIKCYSIFHDLSFCDYIIYGTDDGFIKIRSFPNMNLINYIQIYDSEIVCLELSLDKRYCYAWSKGGDISVIRDISVNDPSEVEQKKSKLK